MARINRARVPVACCTAGIQCRNVKGHGPRINHDKWPIAAVCWPLVFSRVRKATRVGGCHWFSHRRCCKVVVGVGAGARFDFRNQWSMKYSYFSNNFLTNCLIYSEKKIDRIINPQFDPIATVRNSNQIDFLRKNFNLIFQNLHIAQWCVVERFTICIDHPIVWLWGRCKGNSVPFASPLHSHDWTSIGTSIGQALERALDEHWAFPPRTSDMACLLKNYTIALRRTDFFVSDHTLTFWVSAFDRFSATFHIAFVGINAHIP